MIEFVTFLVLMALGYGFGQYAERKHYRSILEREKRFRSEVLVFQTGVPPEQGQGQDQDVRLVMGSVVISVDYFKRFLAGLRALFGGRVKSYESLLDRARREAVLRMQQEASKLGAGMVINLRMETASISKGEEKTVGSVEVLAYGTAIITRDARSRFEPTRFGRATELFERA